MKKLEKVTKKPVNKKPSSDMIAINEIIIDFHERISVLECDADTHQENFRKIEKKYNSEKEFRSAVLESLVIIHNLFVELMEKKSLVGKIRRLFTNK